MRCLFTPKPPFRCEHRERALARYSMKYHKACCYKPPRLRSAVECVALALQKSAISLRSNPTEFDLFGRSSFNRYYYSVFLVVKDALGKMNASWARCPHKDVPEILSGSIRKHISSYRRKAIKIEDEEAVKYCNQAISAVDSLAALMVNAYSVRVTADYRPDILIDDLGESRFKLDRTNITEAHDWSGRARLHLETILRAWKLADG